jgi:hypothetical protein
LVFGVGVAVTLGWGVSVGTGPGVSVGNSIGVMAGFLIYCLTIVSKKFKGKKI